MEHTHLFHNLSILSKLTQGDKLITSGLRFEIYPPSNVRFLHRWWYAEGRHENVERVKSVINSCITTIALCDTNTATTRTLIATPVERGTRMADLLEQAIHGLRNLQETYKGDFTMESTLSLLLQDIDDFLERRKDGRASQQREPLDAADANAGAPSLAQRVTSTHPKMRRSEERG